VPKTTAVITSSSESASETGSTGVLGDRAPGSKNQTIAGKIKTLFRDAVKAVTGRAVDEPQPKARRRRGETEGDFRKLVRQLSRGAVAGITTAARGRYVALHGVRQEAQAPQPETIAILAESGAGDPTWNPFDVTDPLYDHGCENAADFDSGSDFSSNYDTSSHHLSPGM
jgi:hypothetical protein